MRASGGWAPSPTGGEEYQTPRFPATWRRLLKADEVVRAVEERIADATGVPVHPHEGERERERERTVCAVCSDGRCMCYV